MTQELSTFTLADGAAPADLDELTGAGGRSRLRQLAPTPTVLLYGGVALVGAGFLLLAVTWSRVAELLNVALQLPYVVSGGFTGLALVMAGLLCINIAIRRSDAADRAAEADRVVAALHELTSRLDKLQ